MSNKEWINQQAAIAYENADKRKVYGDNPEREIIQKLKEEVLEFQAACAADCNSSIMGFMGQQMLNNKKDAFELGVKNSKGDELADIIITALAAAVKLDIPIINHIELKNWYNSVRE
jgi:hypothetical protein